jgi:uncharacterized protein (DUF1810 family)
VLRPENGLPAKLKLRSVEFTRRRPHYIFPQFDGLGFSSMAKIYAVKSVAEAKAYLSHPILGPRLIACTEAALGVEGKTAAQIFGSPDDLKLRSCATLFDRVAGAGSVFDRLLARYYGGVRDDRTLQLIAAQGG